MSAFHQVRQNGQVGDDNIERNVTPARNPTPSTHNGIAVVAASPKHCQRGGFYRKLVVAF